MISLDFDFRKLLKMQKKYNFIHSKTKSNNYYFFGIIIFFELIFLYYISAFCAIYSIIQVHLISDSLMSFLLTLSYSIILSMIVSIMRITSLKRETKARYVLYMISWILSLV